METILIQDADEAVADVVITALRNGRLPRLPPDGPEQLLETIRRHQL